MAPLPLTDGAAKTAFLLVVIAFSILELRVRVRSRVGKNAPWTDRVSLVVVVLTTAGGTVLACTLVADIQSAALSWRWPLFVIGLTAMVAGIALRQWAVFALGRSFTIDVRVSEGQTVVDTGPYRWVRHPSYTGILVTLLGIGVALGNWASIVTILVVPTAGLVYRIRYEEKVLTEGLGEPYVRFAATRARLVPHVW